MRRYPHKHALVLILAVPLAGYASTAVADQVPDRVLLAPTAVGGAIPDVGAWRREFDGRLSDGIRRTGRIVVLPSRSAVTLAAGCTEAGCARILVERERVDALVSARVLLSAERPPSYRVSVLAYDRLRDELRLREERCPGCSEFQASELLTRLVGEALEVGPRPVPIATSSPPIIALTRPSEVSAPRSPTTTATPRAWLRPLGLSLVVAGGLGLVGSAVGLGVKAAQYGDDRCDGRYPAGTPCPYFADTTPGIAASAVVAALSIGVGIAGAVLLVKTRRH